MFLLLTVISCLDQEPLAWSERTLSQASSTTEEKHLNVRVQDSKGIQLAF